MTKNTKCKSSYVINDTTFQILNGVFQDEHKSCLGNFIEKIFGYNTGGRIKPISVDLYQKSHLEQVATHEY